ncbi:hypothetical protein BL253_30555 [Pseudofrankia asymbiotica]|uniref:Radical SAM core domain-containing protein n=1 Tax=Pseudofrankia asymbiotica TaxID=1834516 RepID=A0A1V2I4P3_9ACTN|nr:hypothetical protein BL253_30555 [Pseudofrankia asymbiotica]
MPPGWAPTPFREFVLKVASRCNLDCDYCYVYHLADQSWRTQPRFMTEAAVGATADRIAEHVRTHDLEFVNIRLHGGEPLLAGRERLSRIAGTLRERLAPLTEVAITVQTNGVLLDEPMAAFLVAQDIGVGISLDGDRQANDLHRTYADGRSSYDEVVAGIQMMQRPEFRSHFLGLLCTIQLAADPVRVWDALLGLGIDGVDFLLPHGTWEHPPPGLVPAGGRTPYADWLVPLFDRWFDAPVRPLSVRTFESLLHLLLGGVGAHESFGLAPVALVVVESDGSYEQVDTMKAVGQGAAASGRTVFADPLDALFDVPAFVQRQLGLHGLADSCRDCDVVTTCGAGLFPHRYRPGAAYANPTVYCADQYALIAHIQRRVEEALARRGTTLAAVRAS